MSKVKIESRFEFHIQCQNCQYVYPLQEKENYLYCPKCKGEIIKILHKARLSKTITLECKSCKDYIYFNTNQARPAFHQCPDGKKSYFFKLVSSRKYKETYTFKQPNGGNKESIGIIQPGKIGDIIITLPIADYYKSQGYKIIWCVCHQYLPYFDYVDYVDETIDLGYDRFHAYNKAQILLDGYCHHIIDLGYTMWSNSKDWVSSGKSFDVAQYDEALLPISLKYNLRLKRNIAKEFELKSILGVTGREDYTVTHSQGSKGQRYDFKVPDAIEVKEMEGYTLFDWIGALEGAKEIYCIDSSVANLINQLGIAKGRRYFRPLYEVYRQSIGEKYLIPHMAEDWKVLK